MLLRWLLPIVAVFALLGQTVTTWAAAGVVGDSACCCPVQAKCKCHDHDGKPAPSPTMKRCGGDAKHVAPAPVPALPVPPVALAPATEVVRVALDVVPSLPDDLPIEPETPPF